MAKAKVLKKKKITKTKKTIVPIVKAEDLPATQGMLIRLQKQMKADYQSLDKKIDSLDSRIDSLDSRIDSLDSRIDSLDSRIDSLDSKIDSNFAKVISEIHRISILFEEQNERNKFVLEGYDQIFKRQDRLELDVDRRLSAIEDVVGKKV